MQFSQIGNYEYLEQINPERGSKTFKVKHKFTGEICVLKIVSSDDPNQISTLESIFKKLSAGIMNLSSPYLITFKDYFVSEIDGSKAFILVSEFFNGQELHSYLEKNGDTLNAEDLLKIYKSTCEAVRDAHSINYTDEHGVEYEGFPHGDIMPWNILVNDNLELRLLDFKLSNKFMLSTEKMDYDQQMRAKLKNQNSISKNTDLSQLGYLLNYLFAKDKLYKSYKLGGNSEDQILKDLDKQRLGNKAALISNIIYKSTNPSTENKYQSVSEILSDLDGEKKHISGKKSKHNLVYAAIILALGSFLAFNIFNNRGAASQPIEVSESRGATPKAAAATNFSAGNYHALMIANENYKNLKRLSRPVADVGRLKNILVNNYGFDEQRIVTKTNASRNDIYDGFEQIERKLGKNDLLLIFYAGHGQLDDSEGYWIPIEAQEQSRRNWISNSEIKHFLNKIPSLKVLLVSDACFGGSILRDISSHNNQASSISNKKTRIALTSGSLESVPDHSVFIDQLFWYLENAQDSIVYASNIFSEIREGIASNTSNDPGYGPIQDSGHQGGDFFFMRKEK